MNRNPRTGASILVVDNGKVLLVKRGKEPHKGKWSLPGGGQELGETLEDCARRELKEETGLEAEALEFCLVQDRILKSETGDVSFHFVLATYRATTFRGTAIAMDDAADLGWFGFEDLHKLDMTPGTPSFLAQFAQEKVN